MLHAFGFAALLDLRIHTYAKNNNNSDKGGTIESTHIFCVNDSS